MGPALIGQVDYLMFTGSTASGRIVAEQCGRRLIDFSAELGGKNPMQFAQVPAGPTDGRRSGGGCAAPTGGSAVAPRSQCANPTTLRARHALVAPGRRRSATRAANYRLVVERGCAGVQLLMRGSRHIGHSGGPAAAAKGPDATKPCRS